MDVYLSVGSRLSPEQERFVVAVETRLRAEGLEPHTLNRNEWSVDAPLLGVCRLMDRCRGALILGLERYRFADGTERPGSDAEAKTGRISFGTPWNQVEAALAYSRKLPLLVLVDENVKQNGLLEPGHDWQVTRVHVDPSALQSSEFNGLLRSWRDRVLAPAPAADVAGAPQALNPPTLTIGQLITAMRPADLWKLVGALVALVLAAVAFGSFVAPGLKAATPPTASADKAPRAK